MAAKTLSPSIKARASARGLRRRRFGLPASSTLGSTIGAHQFCASRPFWAVVDREAAECLFQTPLAYSGGPRESRSALGQSSVSGSSRAAQARYRDSNPTRRPDVRSVHSSPCIQKQSFDARHGEHRYRPPNERRTLLHDPRYPVPLNCGLVHGDTHAHENSEKAQLQVDRPHGRNTSGPAAIPPFAIWELVSLATQV